VGCLLGGSFLTKLVGLVQLPAASLSNSKATRLRLRARRTTLQDLQTLYEDHEDSGTTDVHYRAVRKAGRAHSPTLAPSINDLKISLAKGKQPIFILTAFTTLRIPVSIVHRCFGSLVIWFQSLRYHYIGL
jgi:hypothetical protein